MKIPGRKNQPTGSVREAARYSVAHLFKWGQPSTLAPTPVLMPTAPRSSTDPVDIAEGCEEHGISALCADTVAQIFSHLDAWSLVRMGAVCSAWKRISRDDELWGNAARTRWRLRDKKGRRYKYGERS